MSLSRKAQPGARHGALLRIEHPDVGTGYADCHPWTELGDAPLEAQLRSLETGDLTNLTRNSVDFSRIDAQARACGESLWTGLSIPKSHALVTEIFELLEGGHLERILQDGFDRIKVKLGRDLSSETRNLERVAEKLAGRAKLRLDFNEGLTSVEFASFSESLSRAVVQTIDFIEDPVTWNSSLGFGPKSSVRLAVDRGSERIPSETLCPGVLVAKPAAQDWKAISETARRWNRSLVFTSYLDHPLGQLTAAFAAASTAKDLGVRIESCGLLSHTAYESNRFSGLLHSMGPALFAPEGPGLGWSEELEALKWRELT